VAQERPASIAVIGAGVTGLVAAYRLLQRGYAVQVFDVAPQPGGSLRTFDAGGARLECFYHHLFTSDGAAIRLLDELGLLKTLSWRKTRMGIFYEDKLYPFTSPWDLMRFTPLLGIRDRVRLGLVALGLRRNQTGAGLDEVAALEWMRRHSGGRAVRIVWEPLLRGKFGDLADQVSMAWLWNRIRLRFSSRTLLSRREMLGYQRGSFAVWTDAIADLIDVLGGAIHLNEPVESITRSERGLDVRTAQSRDQTFDCVVATVSNQAFLTMTPGLDADYARKLNDLPYQDARCLVLVLDRSLTDFYWLNVNDRSVPFLAVVEHTKIIDPDRYAGRHMVYITNNFRADSKPRDDADSLLAQYLPHLKRINPDFDERWVRDRWLFYAADAQPVYTVGAASRIPPHRTPVPGLYLANMAQMYPQDRGQNYSILLGEKVAALVADDYEKGTERAST
jgi:protoporphyrinogen oxidase